MNKLRWKIYLETSFKYFDIRKMKKMDKTNWFYKRPLEYSNKFENWSPGVRSTHFFVQKSKNSSNRTEKERSLESCHATDTPLNSKLGENQTLIIFAETGVFQQTDWLEKNKTQKKSEHTHKLTLKQREFLSG